ncbi:MAG TPA: hypothetical protein VH280_14835 [Verrucomicrobiae bacterium]|jgi:hypothetical protein|nr:hypothetical protein [Verrucomicrobiae bacterium]
MHYKNGREAHNGDPVIGRPFGVTWIGMIIDIQPAAQSCNATLLRPAGLVQGCITVGDFYHADDAIEALTPKAEVIPIKNVAAPAPEAAPEPTPAPEPEPTKDEPMPAAHAPEPKVPSEAIYGRRPAN